MPLLRITSRHDALNDETRQQLVKALTDILLEVEVGYAADSNRKVAHLVFDDVDGASHWFANGQPVDASASGPGLIIFDVYYPAGATDQAAKTDLHRRISAAAVGVLIGPDQPPSALFNWVFIHEIAEGSWGARGRTIGVGDIVSGPLVPPGRLAYRQAWLEAEQRLRLANGFPSAIETSI